ncbi:MAG: hypothetical protein M3Q56_02910 [Bacteroidota bacterium]|nr:hypothetical protein [Bacteroidota bacterium]
MYSFTLNLHHYISFAALLTLLTATINGLSGWSGNRPFKGIHQRINLIALIVCHIMLLLGIILLIISPLAISAFGDMGSAMKNGALRKAVIEHPFTNIIAVVLVTVAYSKIKRIPADVSKFRITAIYFGIALILILSRLPFEKMF